MKAKPNTDRFYTSNKNAKLRSGDRELILTKGTSFQLTKYEGRHCVVKDGVLYFVNPKLVPELRNRSSVAGVAKDFVSRQQFLNESGLDVERVLVKNLQSLIADLKATGARHSFVNNKVSVTFNTSAFERPEEIVVEFSMTERSVAASMFVTDIASLEGWPAIPLVEKAHRQFLKYLSSRYSLSLSKSKKHSATLAGVQVAGKPFRGKVVYFSANWNM